MKIQNKKINMYRKQSEFFKALAHPTRFLIVDKLLEGIYGNDKTGKVIVCY